jgi:ribosomal protein S18 acetylase RimI-like enzyme
MAIKIRKAIKTDCAAMMALIHELAVYEKCPEEVTVSMEHFIESGFGTQPIWHAYVACIEEEEEEKIIGLALYYIRYSTWKGQRLYIEDLIVTEQSRGLGVGKLLFDQLITVAAENKFSGIVWQVLDWNEPAINFYKKYPLATFDNGWVNCSINF